MTSCGMLYDLEATIANHFDHVFTWSFDLILMWHQCNVIA